MKFLLTIFLFANALLLNEVISQVPDPVGDDDPDARAAFDIMRTQDPKTGVVPPKMREREIEFSRTIPTKESLAGLRMYKQKRVATTQSLTWTSRGPANVGGRTRALAIDVSDENILLAGGVSGGMWRSTDGGTTWSKVTGVSTLKSVTCIAQDTRPGHWNVWYYGTGELDGNSASGGSGPFRGDGMFKSTDGGVTWNPLPSTVSGTPHFFDNGWDYMWNIAIDPSNTVEDEVYAAVFGAILRSTNGGDSWQVVLGNFSTVENNGTEFSRYTDVAVTSTGVVYATMSTINQANTSSTDAGIWRSTDGMNWVNISGLFSPTIGRITIGIAPLNENIVYFLAYTPGNGLNNHSFMKYTYSSGTGENGSGGTFEFRSSNLPAYGGVVGNYDSQGSYDMLVRVKPDNSDVVFIGGTNLYRSTDGFATNTNTTWIGGYATSNNAALYLNHHPDLHTATFLPSDPNVLFTGDDGGVQRTNNCLASTVAWTSLNNGYTTSQYYTLAIDHGTIGNEIVIGGLQDNGTWFTNTTNGAIAWKSIRGGDGTYCQIADGRSSYYVSTQNSNIYRFLLDDNGNLTGFTRVSPTGGSGYLFVNPFILDPNNNSRMYLAGGTRLWRNNDLLGIPMSSNSTTSVNWDNLTNTNLPGATVTAITVSKTPANRVYFGRNNGHVYRVNNAHLGDPIPTDISGAGFPSGGYVSSIAIKPNNADSLMVVFSNYLVKSIFFSTNGGGSWTDVSGNLEQNPDGTGNGPSVRWASVIPGAGFFVGTSTGLYSTSELNGTSTVWAQEGSNTIGSVVVDMIDYRLIDGTLVVATHGNGVYSTFFPIITPPAPVLSSPPDGSGNQLPSVTVSWSPSFGADTYRLQVATDNAFNTLVYDDSTITNTQKTVEALAANTTFYWRVRGKNVIGSGDWSDVWSFSTYDITQSYQIADRWNLLSVPYGRDDYAKSSLFPTATSAAYIFNGGSYLTTDTLKTDESYWVKFLGDQVVEISGNELHADTINVEDGWNMVGSLSSPISPMAITSGSGVTIESEFFGYGPGYYVADTIRPGKGYWVKVSGSGSLYLSTSAASPKLSQRISVTSALRQLNSLTIEDSYRNTQVLYFGSSNSLEGNVHRFALPPVPPIGIFDARYNTQQFAEIVEGSAEREVPILLSSAEYPVRVSWKQNQSSSVGQLKVGKNIIALDRDGYVYLNNPDEQIAIVFLGAAALPREYALEQNYPNPFNPTTQIRYSLPQESRVILKIFDLLGKEVITLVDQVQEAGFKSVEFNANSVATGLYFYQLEATATQERNVTFRQIRKMTLVR